MNIVNDNIIHYFVCQRPCGRAPRLCTARRLRVYYKTALARLEDQQLQSCGLQLT